MFEKNNKHNFQTNSNKYKIKLLIDLKNMLNKKEISAKTPFNDLHWKVFLKD